MREPPDRGWNHPGRERSSGGAQSIPDQAECPVTDARIAAGGVESRRCKNFAVLHCTASLIKDI